MTYVAIEISTYLNHKGISLIRKGKRFYIFKDLHTRKTMQLNIIRK